MHNDTLPRHDIPSGPDGESPRHLRDLRSAQSALRVLQVAQAHERRRFLLAIVRFLLSAAVLVVVTMIHNGLCATLSFRVAWDRAGIWRVTAFLVASLAVIGLVLLSAFAWDADQRATTPIIVFGIAAGLFVGAFVAFAPRDSQLTQLASSLAAWSNQQHALMSGRTHALSTSWRALRSAAIDVRLLRQRLRRMNAQLAINRRNEQSRRKLRELFRSDWRQLRGQDFERFLGEVFQAKGLKAGLTKHSGDQGVDLIVHLNQYQVAVQAKGYGGSVGNKAVQEVNAGKDYYSCSGMAVITNSHFTPSARDLAQRIGCVLIEGSQFEKFILGDLFESAFTKT